MAACAKTNRPKSAGPTTRLVTTISARPSRRVTSSPPSSRLKLRISRARAAGVGVSTAAAGTRLGEDGAQDGDHVRNLGVVEMRADRQAEHMVVNPLGHREVAGAITEVRVGLLQMRRDRI